MTREVVVLSGARTAIGGFGGSLKDIPPSEMAARCVREAVSRANVEPSEIGHVVFGNIIHTDSHDHYPARVAAIKGGLPVEVPMAGEAYRQLINEFYKENRLIEGTLVLRGERVDLGKLKANVLNVIAEADHITPPCQSEGVMDRIGSQDKEVFRVKGGHIGIMAGSGAEKSTWPHIEQWLTARAD